MVVTVYVDPVIGAALTHLGLPILPALPCPTCGGSGGSLGPNEWQGWRPCPDCNGSGVWTPPDSPVPIGVTSARPEVGAHDGYIVCSVIPKGYVPDYEADDDDFDEAPGRGLMTNDEWAHKFDDISNHNPPHPIVLSSMIGEGTLRKVKVVEADADGHGAVVEMRPDGSLWFWPEGAFGEDAATDISSALPFLPGLKPGDTVYLLDGFTESVRCPECAGKGYDATSGRFSRYGQGFDPCPRCKDSGTFAGGLSCPFPVDAPDHPCVVEVA